MENLNQIQPSRRNLLITFVIGSSLLLPACFGLLLTGTPTVLCPLPFLTIIPAFMLSDWNYKLVSLAILIPMVLFFVWNPALFRGRTRIPKRSLLLLPILTALQVWDFVGGWKYGVTYQGLEYTVRVCIINFAWLAIL